MALCMVDGCMHTQGVIVQHGNGEITALCIADGAQAVEKLHSMGVDVTIDIMVPPKIQLNRRDRPHRYPKKKLEVMDAPSSYRDSPGEWPAGFAGRNS